MSSFSPSFGRQKDKEDKKVSDSDYYSDFKPKKKKNDKSISALDPEKKKDKLLSALEPENQKRRSKLMYDFLSLKKKKKKGNTMVDFLLQKKGEVRNTPEKVMHHT